MVRRYIGLGSLLGIILICAPNAVQAQVVIPDANAATTTKAARIDSKVAARIEAAKKKAYQEIDRRSAALETLTARAREMVHVSETAKQAIAGMVRDQIYELGQLKSKIETATDIETLKTDIASITKSYRIFMLVIPQGRIQVASDRVQTVGSTMNDLSLKLKTRIDEAQAAGKNVTTLSTALVHMNDKVADALAQADAAAASVLPLAPDGGDTTKEAANKSVLKEARAKLKLAGDDLKSARADAKTIVQGLKSLGSGATASSTTSQ